MSILSDIELVRGVIIADDEYCTRMMMEKYADFNGVSYNSQKGELTTAFNGRKCIFKSVSLDYFDRGFDDPHVFLLCLSVVRQASAEETARLNYGGGELKYIPTPLNKAETFAKKIGASKYLECSEVTGEGLDEVFEDSFEVGHNYALEQLRGYRRKMSAAAQTPKDRKISCITQ
ncbi:unnamed protein product [Nippostrongylus brasiliensis]|uniref:Response regulator n=1 Tax=Nippostrongylus brasiliensis TaxID=27835 RepID=A0A0N4YIC0_NIPBR|nr:unnamed protein product [Nippostrongylus brasiliensis]